MRKQENSLGKLAIIFPILLALYEICTYLSNDAYLPALPHIVHDLFTSNHLVQLTLTTWFMGSASMQLFLGPIADRIGRRPVLLLGGLVFIAVTIGCAITSNIYTMLVLRFIQGATITSMIVAGYATIHESFDREKAIHTLSMMASITVLAPSFGPLFGALILQFGNWRMIFAILAGWACIVLAGLFFKMPETNPHAHEKIQLQTIVRQYKNIFCNKSFLVFLLTSRCLFAAMIAWIAAGPFLLIDRFHYGTIGFGISQVFIFGSYIVFTRLVKFLMTKLTLKKITTIGITITTLGASYALIASLIFPNTPLNIIIAMMLIAGGSGLVFPIFERLGIESSQEPMGSKVAVSSLLMGLAGMFGSALISGFYNDTLLSLSTILLLLCVIAVVLRVVIHGQFDQTTILQSEDK